MILVILLAIFLDIFVFFVRTIKTQTFFSYFHMALAILLTMLGIVLVQFYGPIVAEPSITHADLGSSLIIYGIISFSLNMFVHSSLNLFSIFVKLLTLVAVCFSNIIVQLFVINLVFLYDIIFLKFKRKEVKLVTEILLVLSWLFVPVELTGEFWAKYSIWPLFGINSLYIFTNRNLDNRIHHAFLSIPLFVANFQILSNWNIQDNKVAASLLVFIGFVQFLIRGPLESLKKQFPFSLVVLLFSIFLAGVYLAPETYSAQFFLVLFAILMLKGYFRLNNKEMTFEESIVNQILKLIFLIAPGFPLYTIFNVIFDISQIWLKAVGSIWNIFICTVFVMKIYLSFLNYKIRRPYIKSLFALSGSILIIWSFWIFNLKDQYNIYSGQEENYKIIWNANDFIISFLSIILGVTIGFLFCSKEEWKLWWEKSCLKIISLNDCWREKIHQARKVSDRKIIKKQSSPFAISSDAFIDLLTDRLKIALAVFFLLMAFMLAGLFL